jgi:hypothetical protein
MLRSVILGFDWISLPKDSLVVDVGGSVGTVTLILTKAFPHLRYVVQDLQKVVKYDAPKVRTLGVSLLQSLDLSA